MAREKKKWLVNFKNREKDKGVKNNPSHFIFFDTETTQRTEVKQIGKKEYKTTINTLRMGWACYWNKETNETEWKFFTEKFTFWNFITSIINRTGKKPVWIIAHNVVFDNIITDIWTYFKEHKYETEFIHSKSMVFVQHYKKFEIYKEKKRTIKQVLLINNGNIFPATLKKIGKVIGQEKMEVDFEKATFDELKEYCKGDVEVLLVFWRLWVKFISDNNLGNIKYTISAQSMEAYKKKFCKDFILLDNDLDNLAFERKGYYGGRTEIFHKGIVAKPIFYNDVNSMYPHVMKSYKYPREFSFSKQNPTIDLVLDYVQNRDYLIMAECNIETTLNAYPVRRENSLTFPTGKFTTYLATPEVLEAITNNDLISFGKVSFYKSAYLFTDYIDFFYTQRMKMKTECYLSKGRCIKYNEQFYIDKAVQCSKNPEESELIIKKIKKHISKCKYLKNPQEEMWKLFLNSLYGKFGQLIDKWLLTTEDEIKEIDSNFDFDKWILDDYKFAVDKILIGGLDVTPKIRYIGGELQMSYKQEESNISFPAIAAHVTSYARMIIWKAMKYCKAHNIKYFYCDTDSIFTDSELPAEIVDENELGKFKIEKVYDHGVEFINLKNYCKLDENLKKVVENERGDRIIFNSETILNESKIIKGYDWKMKGVSGKAEIKMEENRMLFITQEWGGLPRQEYYTKFGRKADEFWVIEKVKENKDIIKKGVLSESGDILPFVLVGE